MKARPIPLQDVRGPQDAMRRILSVRFAEVLAQAPALSQPRPEPLHDLRIACKRLRYAVELFADALPECKSAERRLSQLQDELGEAHDCDVLLQFAKQSGAQHLAKRVLRDRERRVKRAANLWERAFARKGAFSSLIGLTGLGAALT